MKGKRVSKRGRPSAAVARYLASRGVEEDLVGGGLDAAIDRWDAIARSARDYDFTLDDWLNDMDLRDIIEGAMNAAEDAERNAVRKRLDAADERLRAATVETGSIWGDAMADSASWDPKRTWWYFRRPANPGETMREDLDSAGL